jgi:hypothetical protein
MKISIQIVAVTHLSLCASAAETRLRRLTRDPYLDELRMTLMQIRDIDGTAITNGPHGATARMSMDTEESSGVGVSAKSSKYPVTTALPVEGYENNDATAIIASLLSKEDADETAKTSAVNKAKSGKIEQILSMGGTDNNMSMDVKPSEHHGKHHDRDSKANKAVDMSVPTGKAEKIKAAKSSKEPTGSSMEYETKADKETLSMDIHAEKPALSMDSKAAKTGSKAEKEALSMPAAKTAKEEAMEKEREEADEFWLEYDAKTGHGPVVDAKAEKTISLSMEASKAAKMSMPAGKTTKEDTTDNMSMGKSEKTLSMDSKAGKDHTVTLTITEDYVSHLSPVDAKAGKALSMNNSHRLFPKSGKADHSLSL